MAQFSALKRLGFATISTYLELLGSFVVSAIVARSLGPEDYGAYAFLIWMSGLVIAFANLGFGNAAIKFVAESRGAEDMEKMAGVRRRLGRMQLALIGVALIVFLAAAPFAFLPRIPTPYHPAIWFLVVASAAKAMYMLHFSSAKGMEKFSAVAQVVSVTLPVQLALVGWAAWQDRGVLVFIAIHTAVSLTSLLLMRYQVNRANPEPAAAIDQVTRKRMNRHLVLVSLAFVVHILGRQQIEIYFLSLYSTQASIGYFALAFALAKAARELLPGVFDVVLFPMLARTYSSASGTMENRLLSSMRYMVFLSVPVSLLGVELASQLIFTIYGESYQPAVYPLQVFLAIVIFGAFSSPAVGYLQSIDKQSINLAAGIVGAVTNIVLDIVLISRYGLTGAVHASAVAALTVGTIVIIMMMKHARIGLPLRVTGRLLICGLLAVLPIHFLMPKTGTIIELGLGSILFLVIYVPLTFLLGCWSRRDLKTFAALLAAAPGNLRCLQRWVLLVARRHPMLPHC